MPTLTLLLLEKGLQHCSLECTVIEKEIMAFPDLTVDIQLYDPPLLERSYQFIETAPVRVWVLRSTSIKAVTKPQALKGAKRYIRLNGINSSKRFMN